MDGSSNLNPWVILQSLAKNPVNYEIEEGRGESTSLSNALSKRLVMLNRIARMTAIGILVQNLYYDCALFGCLAPLRLWERGKEKISFSRRIWPPIFLYPLDKKVNERFPTYESCKTLRRQSRAISSVECFTYQESVCFTKVFDKRTCFAYIFEVLKWTLYNKLYQSSASFQGRS